MDTTSRGARSNGWTFDCGVKLVKNSDTPGNSVKQAIFIARTARLSGGAQTCSADAGCFVSPCKSALFISFSQAESSVLSNPDCSAGWFNRDGNAPENGIRRTG